ncbi:zinc finger protein CONSTANS-LIKE 1-like isoform X2 [Hibiscus syriacus]|uniref:Zinc finger protein CONSTANS-LIKE 1-like isoform X2 n=1 Tax=Hibiscus syriacus TaxID=106335 RepID=A0A6A2XHJ5_HIBSY|nr:zinc finger protein CONSTANS-LIKE 1-like isoform X2 [Hibiscus syriacus]
MGNRAHQTEPSWVFGNDIYSRILQFYNNSVRVSMISEYDLGGEGDLFKAPEPIIEEPGDISLMSQGIKAADVESIQNEQLLDVLYECEKDMMAQAVIETPLPVVLDLVKTDENRYLRSEVHCITDMSLPLQKSVSSGCLSSMEWVQGAVIKPNFPDFTRMDFRSAFGMRRAFSEGDIQTLGNGNVSTISSHPDQPIILSICSAEDRREKLSRYRNKKTKRNFARKIKYACRKGLADRQPRIRGRFAKTEECVTPRGISCLSNKKSVPENNSILFAMTTSSPL